MSEESGKSFFASIPLPGLIAVITGVMGTLLFQYEPLTSQRPEDPNRTTTASTSSYQINSTLYEDPFSVVARTTFADSALPETYTNPRLISEANVVGSSKKKVLIIPVFMKPGTDRVTSEVRSRTRLAVIQGLASSAYVPESGKIECFAWPPADKKAGKLVIPFERFEPSDSMLRIETAKKKGVELMGFSRGDRAVAAWRCDD